MAASNIGDKAGSDAVAVLDVGVVRGTVTALEHVTARVPAGSCTAVIGPNGAGKTSLILAILGELSFSGRILFPACVGGRPRTGFVPQQLHFDRGMPLTVLEFLALGLQRRPIWLGIGRTVRTTALELLESVQAAHLAPRRLGALSGGEAQRVLLAMALSREPELLVLDEPAAGVDPHGEQLFCELLERLQGERGFTQIMITHDLGMVAHHADHVLCLNKTLVAEGAPDEVMNGPTIMRLFGLHMLLPNAERAACPAICGCAEKNAQHDGNRAPSLTLGDETGSGVKPEIQA